MIRRTKNFAAQTALRDKSINALRRFRRRAFGLIKRGEMIFQNVRNGGVFARPRRFIQRADKKFFQRAVVFFLGRELDGITFRLLQDQQRDLK